MLKEFAKPVSLALINRTFMVAIKKVKTEKLNNFLQWYLKIYTDQQLFHFHLHEKFLHSSQAKISLLSHQ